MLQLVIYVCSWELSLKNGTTGNPSKKFIDSDLLWTSNPSLRKVLLANSRVFQLRRRPKQPRPNSQ